MMRKGIHARSDERVIVQRRWKAAGKPYSKLLNCRLCLSLTFPSRRLAQSVRIAIIGSTRAARSAGSDEAIRAIMKRSNTDPPKAIGSLGLTP
jgi:hypothetical protein